jgi:CheY-like chemotaxis protein
MEVLAMRGTVLIVDDDEGLRQSLGEFLEAEGYRVLSASNGRHALGVLEDETPSLILIDVAMPVMSGWKLCEALSHYPDLARIPRLLIEKPVNPGKLASAIAARVRPAPSTVAA